MKTILQKLALSFVVAGSAVAANAAGPLVPVPGLGENAGLSALLDASVAYNDNIYLDDSGEKSDTIFTVSPGVLFSTGDEGRSTATLRFVENFAFYMDETDNNRALENIDFTFGHGAEGDKLRLSVAAGFHHNQSASSRTSSTRGSMTRSYNYFANALFSYKVGEKTSVRTGFKWNGLSYQNHREYYNDREQYAVPLYLYYAVTEKLNVGLSGEYRYVDLAASGQNRANGLNPGIQQVWFFGLSAEGRAWEKLSLNGRIGYTSSDYSHRSAAFGDSDKDTMGMSIAANYRATEKLTTTLSLSRDFELDGAGQDITSTSVRLGGVYKIDDFWSANAALSYTNDDYDAYNNREDDIYALDIGVGYAINEYWSAYANYRFAIDDSNSSDYDYTNNIVTVGVSFRY